MQVRTYVLRLMAAAFAAFACVAAVNLIVDPEEVFHTGLVGASANPNDRYMRYYDYASGAERYDGLLFGSSRSRAVSLKGLSARMNGATFARFSVSFGSIIDYVPMLEYVLRDKDRRGERLRAVFLLLDAEDFGLRPPADKSIQQLLPPAMSGRSAFSFWWTNLTAIQLKAWEDVVRRARDRQPGGRPEDTARAHGAAVLAGLSDLLGPGQARAQATAPAPAGTNAVPPSPRPANAEDLPRQLALLEQFVRLCGQHGVALVVAASPVSREDAALLDPAALSAVVAAISRVVPIWDFTTSDWLADRPELWADRIHFRPEVASLMLGRIFGDELPSGWSDYGQLRTAVRSGRR
jgi:hypothetical protein